MAVIGVAKLSITGAGAGLNVSSLARKHYYLVRFDGPDIDNAQNALTASFGGTDVPQPGDALGVTNLVVDDQSVDPVSGDDSGMNFVVTITYRVNPYTIGGGAAEPWSRKARLQIIPKAYERVMYQDFADPPLPIKNTAGDWPETPLTRTIYNPLVRATFARQTSFDPFDYWQYFGKLNASSFTLRGKTIDAEKAVLHNLTAADAVWRDGTLYWDITMEIEIEAAVPVKTVRLANTGFYEKFTHEEVQRRRHAVNLAIDPLTGLVLTDDQGRALVVPVTTPVFLDADGQALLDPTQAQIDATALEFVYRETADWGFNIT